MRQRKVTITVLSDNRAAYGLEPEHGLAFWIETPERNILFDTGRGEAMPRNAETLGIDLASADVVALSHGHYDHTGNVPLALSRADRSRLFLHPDALQARYSIHDAPKPIGMPEASQCAVRSLPDARRQWVSAPCEVDDGVSLSGPVPRETAFEDAGGPFFLDADGALPDALPDDQSLWIKTDAGLVVCLGCCHAGVVNTLRYVTRAAKDDRIAALIGGMHLLHADHERLERTTAALREYAIPHVFPCHCTGEAAMAFLEADLGPSVQPGYAGMKVRF